MQRDMAGGQPGAQKPGMYLETYTADKFAAKNVLGASHDCDRYQRVLWYWSVKQICSAEPRHLAKR